MSRNEMRHGRAVWKNSPRGGTEVTSSKESKCYSKTEEKCNESDALSKSGDTAKFVVINCPEKTVKRRAYANKNVTMHQVVR
jgi:hypothetical protein